AAAGEELRRRIAAVEVGRRDLEGEAVLGELLCSLLEISAELVGRGGRGGIGKARGLLTRGALAVRRMAHGELHLEERGEELVEGRLSGSERLALGDVGWTGLAHQVAGAGPEQDGRRRQGKAPVSEEGGRKAPHRAAHHWHVREDPQSSWA